MYSALIVLVLLSSQALAKIDVKVIKDPSGSEERRTVTNLHELKDVETIIVRSRLPKLTKDMLKDLPRLKVLDISEQGVEEIEEGALSRLPNLRILNLEGNKLKSIKKSVFNHVPLENIHLAANEISHIDTDAFDDMPNLDLLELDRNHLEKIDTLWWKNTPKLQTISLTKNKIERVPARSFRQLAGNEMKVNIKLSSNKIREIEKGAFDDLRNVVRILLDTNSIEEVPEMFKHLVRGSLLDLSNNRITKLRDEVVVEMKKFEGVCLRSNRIPQKDMEVLRGKLTMKCID